MASPVCMKYKIEGDDYMAAGIASNNIKTTLKMLGLSPEICRRVAVIAYEAEMNLVIHAFGGLMKVLISEDKLVMTTKDQGPGIVDISKAMTAGFSTASDRAREMGFGAGMGLPNIKKNCDIFDIQSEVGKGTRLTCTIFF